MGVALYDWRIGDVIDAETVSNSRVFPHVNAYANEPETTVRFVLFVRGEARSFISPTLICASEGLACQNCWNMSLISAYFDAFWQLSRADDWAYSVGRVTGKNCIGFVKDFTGDLGGK